MQLHHPVPFTVFRCHSRHEGILEFGFLFRVRQDAVHPFSKDRLDLILRCRGEHHIVQSVVAQFASMVHEEVQTRMQGFLQICETVYLHSRRFFQPGYIFRIIRLFQVHGFVRTPGRQNRHREGFVRGQLFMPFQAVHRIIRCADDFYIAPYDESAGGIAFFLQFRVRQVPYFPGSFPVQDPLIAEEAPKLQVTPVMQGIADRFSQNLSVFLKLFPVRGIAGNIFLRHSRRPHQTPLIVIAAQPHLGDIFVPDILPDFLRAQMAVVINDRHPLRRFVVKLFRRFRVQQKIFVQEHLHLPFLPA